MKNLLKKVLSVAAATALLMTSVISASAANPHVHRTYDTPITGGATKYNITLTKPTGEGIEIKDGHYGAYQIFTGTVPDKVSSDKGAVNETENQYLNPGTEGAELPITDIKWGNAFGNENSTSIVDGKTEKQIWQENIVGFVIALAHPYEGEDNEFKSAFAHFDGFFDADDTKSFVKQDGGTYYLADRFIDGTANVNGSSSSTDLDKVKFDKLATEVAEVVAAHNDREWLQAFTDILGGYGENYGSSTKANKGFVTQYYASAVSGDNYTIGVPESGYYMILDRTAIVEGDTNEAFSARMLFVVNNVSQVLKEDIPKLHKTISRDDGVDEYKYETEAAGVGDEVDFRLTGTLPSNYDQYTLGYEFIFTDILSKGLTLKGTKGITSYPYNYGKATTSDTDFVVKVKGVYKTVTDAATSTTTTIWEAETELTINLNSVISSGIHTHEDDIEEAYSAIVTTAADGQQTLTVTFPCLKEISIIGDGTNGDSGATYTLGVSGNEESEIYIDYTAVVNENAIVNPTDGNKNTATLTYSDNPQSYGDTDTTTPDNATVYTFGLDIVKVDAAQFLKNDGNTSADDVSLSGAKFILARPSKSIPDDETTWKYATFEFIDADTAKAMTPNPAVPSFTEYGYYSIVSWTPIAGKTGAAFDPSWVTSLSLVTSDDQGNVIQSVKDGYLNISGLNDGVTYTIAETEAPGTDYAKIDPFTITLTAAMDDDEYTGTLESADVSNDVTDDESFTIKKFVKLVDPNAGKTDDNGSASTLVANFKYADLPSTGGIGVYIYYIAGGCVVALALVLFALSKKKKTTK